MFAKIVPSEEHVFAKIVPSEEDLLPIPLVIGSNLGNGYQQQLNRGAEAQFDRVAAAQGDDAKDHRA